MIIKMNKHQIWGEIFAANKKLIVSVVVVFGGLITRESYFLLKRAGVSRFRQFLARAVITVYLSLLLNSYIETWAPLYHFLVLGIFAISSLPILDWFLNKLLPALLASLKATGVKWITSKADELNKSDQEGGKHD
jgi:hypothetical protein